MYNRGVPANRFRSHRVEAVVLRHQDWGETDRLLWLFTLEQGKLRAVAKGVRKARSRKAGHLEPFTRVSLLLAEGRDLPIITQAEAQATYPGIHNDLERIAYAAYVIELLDRFTFEEGENGTLYRLLVDTLTRLDAGTNPALTVHYYEMRLLDQVGFRPRLFECASCGEEIKARDQFFSALHGGILCPRCGTKDPACRPASQGALRVLRHVQRSRFEEAQRLPVPDNLDREVEDLMGYYFTYMLERSLNTPAFLRRLRKPGSASPEKEKH
jgi:DNA repair protein RecO (recombination protein O)